MTAAALLEQLQHDGLQVRVDGERLLLSPREKVTPAVVELVRQHKPALLDALTAANAAGPAVSASGRLVMCSGCRHFEGRPGAEPDGECGRFGEPTWDNVAFSCIGFTAVDDGARALEGRCMRVTLELARHREQRVAAHVMEAPLRPEPGEPVSVVIAVRTSARIVSAELRLPRDRFDTARFLDTLAEDTLKAA